MTGRSKKLGIAVAVFSIVGLLLAAVPFIGSLAPTERTRAMEVFQRVDVSDFERNTYQLIRVRPSKRWSEGSTSVVRPGRAWLVIRDDVGHFRVFGLPTWDDSILMPLRYWGQFEGYCRDLGPARDAVRIDAGTQIVCNDEDNDQFFRHHWYWSLDGRNLSGSVVNLEPIRTELQRDELVVLDPPWNL